MNGNEKSTITLVLKDANGNPVSGQQVRFNSSLANVEVSNVTDQGEGSYTAALSGTQSGAASITVQINGSAFAVAATTVTLTADESSATIGDGDFTVGTGAVANGKESNTLRATVQDAQSNPVADIEVTFAVTEGQATLPTATVKTNAQGVAEASLVSLVAGDNQVTAQVVLLQ